MSEGHRSAAYAAHNRRLAAIWQMPAPGFVQGYNTAAPCSRVMSPEPAARLVLEYVAECWVGDTFVIKDRKGNIVSEVKGHSSWAFTVAAHSPPLQREQLVLLDGDAVRAASAHVPGFADILRVNTDVDRRW